MILNRQKEGARMAGYIIRDREKTLVLPCRQVDQLLQAADGDAALLYLYLMRRTDAVTAEQIMQSLSMSALRLQAAQSRLEGMGLLQSQRLPVPEPARQPAEYTAAELGEMLRDGEFRMLVEETERCLGKKLTTLDIKRLANLRHEVGLPADVIFLLVRHCVEEQERRFGEGRRPTVSAVEKEGYYWARRGLFDQESAARYLRTVARRREQSVQYMAAMHMGDRRSVEAEEKYIAQWMDWGFSPEMVALAYEKTVLKKQGMDWRYLNGILRRWDKEGLRTLRDVQEEKRPAAGTPDQNKNKKQIIEEYLKW